jgi:hypothetical protein
MADIHIPTQHPTTMPDPEPRRLAAPSAAGSSANAQLEGDTPTAGAVMPTARSHTGTSS